MAAAKVPRKEGQFGASLIAECDAGFALPPPVGLIVRIFRR